MICSFRLDGRDTPFISYSHHCATHEALAQEHFYA